MIPGVNIAFEGIPEEVVSELCRGVHAKDWFESKQAALRQKVIARQSQNMRSVDGLGRPGMVLDPAIYHAWAKKFGSYDCWHKSKELTQYLQKHFPETRPGVARNESRVGWTPGVEGGAPRWRKTYSEPCAQ